MDVNNICGGIVTYNPDAKLFNKVIAALTKQVNKVYIWDNGSGNYAFIKGICDKYGITLLSNQKNEGIAYALNQLCDKAIEDGFNWILTLDHDTIISSNYITQIDLNLPQRIGILCPSVEYVGVKLKKDIAKTRYEEVEACMTSGSVMCLSAWSLAGKFNNWLFIDSVDNDICYKLRQNGFSIIRDNHLKIIHNLGKPINRKKFFYNFIDFQYSPFRIYYIVRNRIYITKKYWRLNGIRFVGASCKILLNAYLSSLGNDSKIYNFKKGFKDGLASIFFFTRL